AVFGNVVTEDVGGGYTGAPVKLKKRCRGSAGEAAFGAHWHCCEHAGRSKVENFFAITTPARFTAASARNLPLPGSAGEGGHVNLPVPRLIGGVRYPFPVGSDLPVNLASRA